MAYDKVVDSAQLDADLKVVADAIREKGGTTEQLSFPQGMKQAVEAIQSGGGSGENINPLDYATYLNGGAFRNAIFPENTKIKVKLNGTNSNLANQYSYTTNLTEFEIDITDVPTVNIGSMLSSSLNLEKTTIIGNTNKLTSFVNLFSDCKKLKVVNAVLDFSNITNVNNMFKACESLEEVRFSENTLKNSITFEWSSKLSNESIQSIINGLADLTGLTSQTLTLNAFIKPTLTETHLATITGKNWTLA